MIKTGLFAKFHSVRRLKSKTFTSTKGPRSCNAIDMPLYDGRWDIFFLIRAGLASPSGAARDV